jgi:hypothetical protein
LTGYLHRDYVESLSEFGRPRHLPGCDGWLLERAVSGIAAYDAMGAYPLFCCRDWPALADDVTALADDLVSVVLITNPLGTYSPEMLERGFDRVVPYKEHFVVETGQPLAAFVTRSHRANAERALREVSVELCPNPAAFIDEWERLYAVLAARHSIAGLRRFSRQALERQFAVPGLVMFRAIANGHTVGLDLWYVQEDCAQGHLAAFDQTGYALHASYATKWCVLDYFSNKVRWVNLGAGSSRNADDGLSRFKRGWSTGTKTAWLCGRVLQPAVYAALARTSNAADPSYFPVYRCGEFG